MLHYFIRKLNTNPFKKKLNGQAPKRQLANIATGKKWQTPAPPRRFLVPKMTRRSKIAVPGLGCPTSFFGKSQRTAVLKGVIISFQIHKAKPYPGQMMTIYGRNWTECTSLSSPLN